MLCHLCKMHVTEPLVEIHFVDRRRLRAYGFAFCIIHLTTCTGDGAASSWEEAYEAVVVVRILWKNRNRIGASVGASLSLYVRQVAQIYRP